MELLVVIAIVGVLAGLAIPAFAGYMRQLRLSSNMSDLVSDIQLARSEAAKRNVRVLFCPRDTPTGTSCIAVVTASSWTNGWLTCYDSDADSVCDAGTAALPNPIKFHPDLVSPVALTGPTGSVVFLPNGSTLSAATFSMLADATTTRTATLAVTGAVVSSKTSY